MHLVQHVNIQNLAYPLKEKKQNAAEQVFYDMTSLKNPRDVFSVQLWEPQKTLCQLMLVQMCG